MSENKIDKLNKETKSGIAFLVVIAVIVLLSRACSMSSDDKISQKTNNNHYATQNFENKNTYDLTEQKEIERKEREIAAILDSEDKDDPIDEYELCLYKHGWTDVPECQALKNKGAAKPKAQPKQVSGKCRYNSGTRKWADYVSCDSEEKKADNIARAKCFEMGDLSGQGIYANCNMATATGEKSTVAETNRGHVITACSIAGVPNAVCKCAADFTADRMAELGLGADKNFPDEVLQDAIDYCKYRK
jgi:hypothetical protein